LKELKQAASARSIGDIDVCKTEKGTSVLSLSDAGVATSNRGGDYSTNFV